MAWCISWDSNKWERCWIILGRAWVSSELHLECPLWHAAICPARLLWLHGHWLSFTVKPWASRGIPAMYEQLCQVRTLSQCTSCCLSPGLLIACLFVQSSDSYLSSQTKYAVHAANAFNLVVFLLSLSLSCWPCSLAVALEACSHTA